MSAAAARAGPIGVGVIGLGFMGSTHVRAYRAADAAGWPNRLVAVCDADPERRAGRGAPAGNLPSAAAPPALFDPRALRAFAEPAALFADPEVELVSICTPTETHVELALAALAAGKHVLVEKPVALCAADVQRLAEAAARTQTSCMPAYCIRFWPAWARALEALRAGALGSVQSAVFRRLAARPAWSRGFYGDAARSGGALGDLHVHDTDFIVAAFGPPRAVTSAGTLDHLTTLYHYPGGPAHVAAEAGWDHAPSFDFRMAFTIVGSEATLDCALGREPELVCFRGALAEPIALATTTGYDEEVRHLLASIARGSAPAVTIADALCTARVLDAERASLARGATCEVEPGQMP